jgi:hypothetical protein
MEHKTRARSNKGDELTVSSQAGDLRLLPYNFEVVPNNERQCRRTRNGRIYFHASSAKQVWCGTFCHWVRSQCDECRIVPLPFRS